MAFSTAEREAIPRPMSQSEANTLDGKLVTKRHQEHFEIAKKLGTGRVFTRMEFNLLYHQEYPSRASPPNPSDYCVNLYPSMAKDFPKFLRWVGRGRYEFVGELSRF
jgi:hypothetical protein